MNRGQLPTPAPAPAAAAVRASRVKTPGWRDPRLWIGLALVAASVVAGALLLDNADRTVQVWAVNDEVAVGHQLSRDELHAVSVRFTDPRVLSRYLAVSDDLPADYVLRPLGAGDLLPVSALGTAETSGVVQVSVSVGSSHVPPAVRAGSRVDVWIIPAAAPAATKAKGPEAEALYEDVTITDAPTPVGGFAASASERQLVLGIPADAELAPLISASRDGRLMIVGRG